MRSIDNVAGLYIQENVLTVESEIQIIQWLDSREWSEVLPRRTQHFGYIYGYKRSNLIPGDPFEGWVSTLMERLTSDGVMESIDQCIVNEYDRDQKIGKHIDGKRGERPNIFGPKIVSISVGADTNFIFINTDTKEKVEIYVPRRSMIVMSGDSRYKWTHEIPRRLSVKIDGKWEKKKKDYRRISLTFRKTVDTSN